MHEKRKRITGWKRKLLVLTILNWSMQVYPWLLHLLHPEHLQVPWAFVAPLSQGEWNCRTNFNLHSPTWRWFGESQSWLKLRLPPPTWSGVARTRAPGGLGGWGVVLLFHLHRGNSGVLGKRQLWTSQENVKRAGSGRNTWVFPHFQLPLLGQVIRPP